MIKTDTLIIGAGPVGLFCVHQLGIIGLKCEVVDNLDKIGGQCIELYPDKPIYDIPAVPKCTGEELTNNLIEQMKVFKTNFHLNERVQELKKIEKKWIIKTNRGTEFEASSIIIAGGVGSFEPRKFPTKEIEKYEEKQILYSIKDKKVFKDKTVSIFGGGDSALDWAIELSNTSKVILVHRRDDFRGMQASIDKVNQLKKKNKIEIYTKYQLDSVRGKEKVENINIKHDDSSIKEIKTDYVLGFFGLIMQLGPIAEWGLNLDKKNYSSKYKKF
tara:strand:+ start:18 stop:836 length:819 start_codon:yes stop_codon:yes gene_type:complete